MLGLALLIVPLCYQVDRAEPTLPGPTPAFAAIKGLKLISGTRTALWVRGRYEVVWKYAGVIDPKPIIAGLRSEARPSSEPTDTPRVYLRTVGGVRQVVEIGRRPSKMTKPGGLVNDGTVTVTETPLLAGPEPADWWTAAVSPTPPVPLQPSPLDGVSMPAAVRKLAGHEVAFLYVMHGSRGEALSIARKSLPKRGYKETETAGLTDFVRDGQFGESVCFYGERIPDAGSEPAVSHTVTVAYWRTLH